MIRPAQYLADLLYPRKCLLCEKLLGKDETDLCHRCRTEAESFSGTKKEIPFVAGWTALWYYEGTVRDSLLRYKFSNHRSYAETYGRFLAMKLSEEGLSFDLLTWVPVSRRRKWKRGYDQDYLIAAALGKELGIRPIAVLRKIRNNRPQSGMQSASARRANVLGVYRPVHPEMLTGKRILLIDDIITTGATVSECARVLLTAGAAEVTCAAVAAGKQRK